MKYTDNFVEDVTIAYIGGGSRGWAWTFMTDLALDDEISGIIRLYDIDTEAAEVNAVLKEAIVAYEKVRELDPNHEQISNWPVQLRMLYNAVGETAKAQEITKMLGDN